MPLRPPSLTLSLLLIALPLLAPASPANAGDSRWRQGWGLASPVATARPDGIGQQADFAELRLQRRGGGHEAVVRNLLAGPLQVRLRYRDPGREAIAPVLLAAGEQRRLLWLADTSAPLALTLDAFPGDPGARADGYRYRLPFAGQAIRVSQGVGGRHSHQDRQNYYAIDFPLAEGTAVLAAREGTVMQALADSPQEGSLLRILHRDGSMALYGHLYPGSALVRPGQTVAVGDPLARSGSSGHSSGPHLHFAVQTNRGLQLEAIPFRMDGPLGELHFARDDDR